MFTKQCRVRKLAQAYRDLFTFIQNFNLRGKVVVYKISKCVPLVGKFKNLKMAAFSYRFLM